MTTIGDIWIIPASISPSSPSENSYSYSAAAVKLTGDWDRDLIGLSNAVDADLIIFGSGEVASSTTLVDDALVIENSSD